MEKRDGSGWMLFLALSEVSVWGSMWSACRDISMRWQGLGLYSDHLWLREQWAWAQIQTWIHQSMDNENVVDIFSIRIFILLFNIKQPLLLHSTFSENLWTQCHSMLARYKEPNIALQAYSLSSPTHKGSVPAFTGNGRWGAGSSDVFLVLQKKKLDLL